MRRPMTIMALRIVALLLASGFGFGGCSNFSRLETNTKAGAAVTLPAPNGGVVPELTAPPHCSKAILTYSHSSRLTRRSAPPSTASQASLDIAIGQSVCFKLLDSAPDGSSREERGEGLDDDYANISKLLASLNNTVRAKLAAAAPQDAIRRRRRRSHRATIRRVTVSSTQTNRTNETKSNETKGRRSSTARHEGPHLLHTLTLTGMELYHAITERYKFAIPEVETSCICECNANSPTCLADEYKYGKCTPNTEASGQESTTATALHEDARPTACYRTFFANQPSHGCPSKEKVPTPSRLCCQLRFRPSGGRRFTALRLGASTTSAVLLYRVYEWRGLAYSNTTANATSTAADEPPTEGWRETERRRFRVQLDGALHNTMLDDKSGLSVIGMGGKFSTFSQQLEQGMYYVENLPDGQLDEIRSQQLNRMGEHDFHKLGWFRLNDAGEPYVQSGDIFLDKVHHARVDNCAEQRYRSVLEASYYVNRENNATSNFRLAEPLWRTQRWIRSAYIYDKSERQAVIVANEGSSLELTLATREPTKRIAFVHNSSQLVDFTASILVDHFSNSLLNLTVYDAKGILNGHVRRLEDWGGEDVDSFSVTVPPTHNSSECSAGAVNDAALSRLCPPTITNIVVRIKPYPINSVQLVCLRPDDSLLSQEMCRPVQTLQYDLEVETVKNDWTPGRGNCANCNTITVDGFMRYLNPANWTKGINSISDALMLVSDIFGYLFILLVLYILVVKIAWPLINCCICPVSTMLFFSKSKSSR